MHKPNPATGVGWKPLAKVAAALKETLCVFADKIKNKALHTIAQGDTSKITSGRGRLLHSCTVRACPVLQRYLVRVSRVGELLLWKKPP